ncbi:MAG: peroxiredoxin [Yoonia sp.]|uniref:peroxiredoxin n=1 Tax=Yoonia sp. TaxID=2212373 RepID=UPI003EF6BFDA
MSAEIDWSLIPAPSDDGKADHLVGQSLPAISLPATEGTAVDLSSLDGICVIYVYPKTGRPDQDLPAGWDDIPGARGCTPQTCSYRDHAAELKTWGVKHLFGLSTQDSDYQAEAAARLQLPFPLLSDAKRAFGKAMDLPGWDADGAYLHKRLTMIAKDGIIAKVFYPVFPPDEDAENVISWLRDNNTD